MFGYVTADKPEMRIKDYAAYKAYYCGLCKTLGKRYGQTARLTVNYDIAFLTLVAHNCQKLTPVFREEHCLTHPVGKKFPVVQNNPVQEWVADVNMILGYYKLTDDIADGGKARYKAARRFLRKKFKKAAKKAPEAEKTVRENYQKLQALEKRRESNIDKTAACFAQMMSELGAQAAGEKADDNLQELCYHLGRWIYLIDAYDDLDADYAEKKFNPFNPQCAELTAEFRENLYENARFNLFFSANAIRDAYDKMDITVSEGPLSNVIYRGIRAKTEFILEKRYKKAI